MAPAACHFSDVTDYSSSASSTDFQRPVCWHQPAYKEPGLGAIPPMQACECSWGSSSHQRKPLVPLKTRKSYFDSAEWAMALEKGEVVEKLPPVPAQPPRGPMERRRSHLSQCSY